MSIESIKARLEAADNVWYIRAPKCEATPATTDLRALLRVAEAAKEVDDALSREGEMWREGLEPEELDALNGLYAALAELEGME